MKGIIMPEPLRKVFILRLLGGIGALILGITEVIVENDIKLLIICFAGLFLCLWAFKLKMDLVKGKILMIDLAFIAAKKTFDSMKVSFADSDGIVFEYYIPRKKYLYEAFVEGHSYRLYFYEKSPFNLLSWEVIS